MPTEVVQFRFPSEEVAFIRSKGVNPNEFARECFEEGLRMFHARRRAESIEALRKRVKIQPGTDYGAIVREDRDAR